MSIHDKYAEQKIAAAEHDLVEAHKRIRKLEELVRDMWRGHDCDSGCVMYDGCPFPSDGRCLMEERMRELRIEVDG